MRMTVLGSGGWIPTSSRQTSCYLITSGTEALILDAGTGFGALHIDPSLLDGVETVTVALSHFHLDHVTGLGFVSARALGGRELTIAGPGSMAYGRPTRSIVEDQLLGVPVPDDVAAGVGALGGAGLGHVELRRPGDPDVGADPPPLAVGRLPRRRPSRLLHRHRVRPGDHPACGGCDHVAARSMGTRHAERGHTSGEEAGTIAVEAGVSRLLITHNHPLPGMPERTAAAARARFDAAISAADGAILEL